MINASISNSLDIVRQPFDLAPPHYLAVPMFGFMLTVGITAFAVNRAV
jgi:hypothetical protein